MWPSVCGRDVDSAVVAGGLVPHRGGLQSVFNSEAGGTWGGEHGSDCAVPSSLLWILTLYVTLGDGAREGQLPGAQAPLDRPAVMAPLEA